MVKKLFYIVALVLLAGCQVIKEEERYIPFEQQTDNTRTHVLIEWTGFRCVNCPTAAELAHELTQIYDPQLIVVAMHPASNPFTQGLYDYTCPEADEYYALMGGNESTPFPKGNINFTPSDGTYMLEPSQWAAELTKQMRDSVSINLQVTLAADSETRKVTISTSTNADTVNLYDLTYWLVEDSIHGAQAMPDGTYNTDYYHRHVLRAKVASECIIPETYEWKHCYIVALIQDKTNKTIQNAKQIAIYKL